MTVYPQRVVSFATGAGTDETAEQTFTIPSNAVAIHKIRGHVHATQGDPAESIFGVFTLTGQDWKHNPYEWFSEIGPSKLGAVDQVGYPNEPRWWPVNLPVAPGGTIAATYEPLDALANNGRANVDVLWSTVGGEGEPTQRLCSRETATSTATGPTLTISGAAKMVDFTIGVAGSTVAADDPSDGRLDLTSSALVGQQTFGLSFNLHTIEATSGVEQTSLFSTMIDIDVDKDPAVVTSAITVTTALTTAAAYAYGLGYRPKSVAAAR